MTIVVHQWFTPHQKHTDLHRQPGRKLLSNVLKQPTQNQWKCSLSFTDCCIDEFSWCVHTFIHCDFDIFENVDFYSMKLMPLKSISGAPLTISIYLHDVFRQQLSAPCSTCSRHWRCQCFNLPCCCGKSQARSHLDQITWWGFREHSKSTNMCQQGHTSKLIIIIIKKVSIWTWS